MFLNDQRLVVAGLTLIAIRDKTSAGMWFSVGAAFPFACSLSHLEEEKVVFSGSSLLVPVALLVLICGPVQCALSSRTPGRLNLLSLLPTPIPNSIVLSQPGCSTAFLLCVHFPRATPADACNSFQIFSTRRFARDASPFPFCPCFQLFLVFPQSQTNRLV